MIGLRVKLFATLREYRPSLKLGEALPVSLPDGATVRDLLVHLSVPAVEVKLMLVNGIFCDLNRVLADGDELGLFPPVGGG